MDRLLSMRAFQHVAEQGKLRILSSPTVAVHTVMRAVSRMRRTPPKTCRRTASCGYASAALACGP
jgi:hypothetical protein